MSYATYISLRPWDDKWGVGVGQGPTSPPPIGVLFLYMHSISHCKIPGWTNACMCIIMRYATYFSLRPRVDKWGEAPPPPPPPRPPTPCVGVRSILVHAFDPPLQDIFLHTPMHTCMTYAMYISLQPYVGRRIRGKCGMPPPPPSRFVYMYALCIRTPFKDSWPCQWIHVSYCMVYDCRSTNTGYTWSEPPPPPPPP